MNIVMIFILLYYRAEHFQQFLKLSMVSALIYVKVGKGSLAKKSEKTNTKPIFEYRASLVHLWLAAWSELMSWTVFLSSP